MITFFIITYALSAIFNLVMVVQDAVTRYYLGLDMTRSDLSMSVIAITCPILNTLVTLTQLYVWLKELFSDAVVIKGRRE